MRPAAASGPGSRSSAVILYCGLAYAITWLIVLPLVASALGWGGQMPEWWHALGALGPLTAAAVAAWRSRDGTGPDPWFRSLTRVDIGARWWTVALASPLALAAGALVAVRAWTGAWQVGAWPGDGGSDAWLVVVLVSVAYGLGEEPGWRGFLLPRLLEQHGPRAATLVLAGVWATWHVPFFFYRYDFAGPMTVVGFLISILAGAFWLTFLYLRTGGSVPAVAAWHVVWNLVSLGLAGASDLVIGVMNAGVMVLGFGVAPLLESPPRPGDARKDAPADG
jgi:membrane protease YdiL (CAAX protease family)